MRHALLGLVAILVSCGGDGGGDPDATLAPDARACVGWPDPAPGACAAECQDYATLTDDFTCSYENDSGASFFCEPGRGVVAGGQHGCCVVTGGVAELVVCSNNP